MKLSGTVPSSRPPAKQGMALLIVLAVLVLITVLVITFLSTVTTELKSSQSYANGSTAKQLADSVNQIVMAQIADATQGQDSGGQPLAWASQPGMIRTYDNNGNPYKYFKLYSSDSLIVSGSNFNLTNDVPPANWDTSANTGLYTDLNSPIVRGGNTFFPVVDPRAQASTTNQSVEGFNYQAAVDGVVLPAAGSGNQRLPMPIRWIYILQNGQLAIPSGGNNGTVSFAQSGSGSGVPSSQNPIVGRIAFWTDDETCKVNINTASEGTFWDRPWANTVTEQQFSSAIPAKNEFQRYPGHPAKTSLSTVFGPVLPSPAASPAWYYGISSGQLSINQSQLNAYYNLTPRISPGGTEGGSINNMIISGSTASPNPAFTAITNNLARLYASADEYLFSSTFTTSGTRTFNNTFSNSLIDQDRFFITAHSRAPELNLFGKPRMTLWPIQMNASARNVYDKLIAFCSTINNQPYYFQRYSTYTSGNASSASSQSTSLDWTGVPRNQTLYTYLNQLTQSNIPGFGGNFQSKYPASRQQILTEMFDMIRGGVNAYSSAVSPQYNYAPQYLDSGEGQVVPLVPPAGTPGAGTHGFGRFVTVTGAAVDFFRSNAAYYTTTGSVTLSPVVTSSTYADGQANPEGVVIKPGAQIGAVLILNPFTPSPGFPPWSPNIQYVVTGLDSFKINSASLGGYASLGFPSTPLNNTVTSRAEYSGQWNCSPFFGLIANFRYAASGTADATKSPGFSDPVKQYPFAVPISINTGASPPQSGVQLAPTDTTFDFSGGTITVTTYAGADTAKQNPIQTISMVFPPVTGLHVPTTLPSWTSSSTFPPSVISGTSLFGSATSLINDIGPASSLQKGWHDLLVYYAPVTGTNAPNNQFFRFNPRLGNGLTTSGSTVDYYVENVTRGVEANVSTNAAAGDYRTYAALANVPSTYFTGCQGYDVLSGTTQKYSNVQSLRDEGTDALGGGGFGYDAAFPGGLLQHYPNTPAGSSNGRDQVLVTSPNHFPGKLLPSGLLAQYGGATGWGSTTGDQEYRVPPAVPTQLTGAYLSNGNYGDWDNGMGLLEDGPFINKPDDGNSSTVSSPANLQPATGSQATITGGYFSFGAGDYISESGTTFSPNRQICSAVMFGSLPTGIDPTGATTQHPWQTLLFNPNPASNSSPGATLGASHPGFGKSTSGSGDSGPPYSTPPDHLFLDLFTMPIVEPYAISEPFSTAGKINMNYQIVPFTYIRRDTGVRAVLKASRIMAIPQSISTVTSAVNSYKDGIPCKYELRYNVNPGTETASPALSDGTLYGLENRFNGGDIFRSASEICEISLVPQEIPNLGASIPRLNASMTYPPGATPPTTYAGTASWWSNFLLTGDNVREAPYSDIYARLTTKSNTFQVHYKVQTLAKVPSTATSQWVEGRDQITGETRGSVSLERYIDVANTALPDFAQPGAPSAEGFYKIRTIGSTLFTP